MDNPKVFILSLLIATMLLILTLWMTRQPSELRQINGKVIGNTLSQSLDGHRRYLSVQLPSGVTVRITVPADLNCPINSVVQLKELDNLLNTSPGLIYSHCTL